MRGKLIFLSDVQNFKCRAKQIYSDDKCPVQGLSYHSGGAKRKFVGKSTISLESWQTHTQTQNIQWTLITLMYTETVSRQCSALNILFFSSLQRCSWNWSYSCIRISFFFPNSKLKAFGRANCVCYETRPPHHLNISVSEIALLITHCNRDLFFFQTIHVFHWKYRIITGPSANLCNRGLHRSCIM